MIPEQRRAGDDQLGHAPWCDHQQCHPGADEHTSGPLGVLIPGGGGEALRTRLEFSMVRFDGGEDLLAVDVYAADMARGVPLLLTLEDRRRLAALLLQGEPLTAHAAA